MSRLIIQICHCSNFVPMFRQITALIFLMAFVSQTFSTPFMMLDYYANTSAYAKNCINKARPKMHCNGKCQVMKKMKEQEKKEQENAERRSSGKYEVLAAISFFPAVLTPAPIGLANATNLQQYNISLPNPSFDFFQPPRCAC